MAYCAECGNVMPDKGQFCPECGSSREQSDASKVAEKAPPAVTSGKKARAAPIIAITALVILFVAFAVNRSPSGSLSPIAASSWPSDDEIVSAIKENYSKEKFMSFCQGDAIDYKSINIVEKGSESQGVYPVKIDMMIECFGIGSLTRSEKNRKFAAAISKDAFGKWTADPMMGGN